MKDNQSEVHKSKQKILDLRSPNQNSASPFHWICMDRKALTK